MNAVCPICGQAIALAEPIPSGLKCPACEAKLTIRVTGKAAHLFPADTEGMDEKDVLALAAEKDPVKKHAALTVILKERPDSLAARYALLMHGRLHERNPKKLDFSIIKCYLLHPYEEPHTHTKAERMAFSREIFEHPDLTACLSLSADPDAFLQKYLRDLCRTYIDLFLLGSSKYNGSILGLIRVVREEKVIASPVARMSLAIEADDHLTSEERALLCRALYDAFKDRFGDTSHLDALIGTPQ